MHIGGELLNNVVQHPGQEPYVPSSYRQYTNADFAVKDCNEETIGYEQITE